MTVYSAHPPFRTKSLLLLAVISLLARMAYSDSSASSELPTSQLITKANSLLATGQASKALELYELVLERDPDDYLTLYKKATTQMSLGQNHHASQSLQKVLSLKDFDKAQIQLARIHLKSGDYEACQTELESFRKNHDKSSVDLSSLEADLKSAQKHLKNARSNIKSKNYSKCVDEASAAIKISPQSPALRQLRSDCHFMQGHIQEATGDLTHVTHLSPNSAVAALRLSFFSYFFLAQPLEQSMKPIKKCLHSDPESKPCKKAFRQLKALEKDLAKVRNFSNSNGHRSTIKLLIPKGNEAEGLIERTKAIIKESQLPDPKAGIDEPLISAEVEDVEGHSKLLTSLYSFGCKAYVGLNELKNSQSICESLHARDDQDVWGIISKAEQLMAAEEWEPAVNLLKEAYSKNEDEDEISSRLRKAQKGLKVSKQKDYYKVLGVPKNADERTLKKAYRKATLKAHPDKGGSQAKMTALNEAYEVLSNPELRARYDNGDDPNDPMSGQHGHPFGGGGNPIFQQFFQQAHSSGGNPFGGQFPGGGSGQTFSFRFG
ncbi:hypothetical protein PGT21_020617 [Puccinia graminis f. sp. tritici]|uniref:Tetratricopeptide repeat and J domain-containing co-chaperone DNJ1 n=2 Tax=Puccinia graminis f. sp. tritici TaxID=56615 RepID=E3K4T1_PUCGT|nr:uncharacterized protein PGTG_05567 [Puccinia graminis f. sp. tritici CRL 75-36-700-3]EFP79246.2 hypothetical protein PGTG_05567 [Puccinia graminis f. sp. tritici CRL 75-36-700-3]KAA1087053.1 hypothetical protein PGT21_020617 [Puccinia graminis f. sp. tritici]